MRKPLLAAAVTALLCLSGEAQAQFNIPGLGGGRGDEEAVSLLQQVRDPAFRQERCAAAAGDETTDQEYALDVFDLWHAAVGPLGVRATEAPPDGARYNLAPYELQQSYALIGQLVARLRQVQPPPEGVELQVWIDPDDTVDTRQTSAGNITISEGAITALRGRDYTTRRHDLMFLVAHEYAHVLLCHYTSRQARARNARALGNASMFALMMVALGNSRADRTAAGTNLRISNQDRMNDQMLMVLAGTTLLRTANDVIVNPNWSRNEERDADRLAVELMEAAGVTPRNLDRLLGAMNEADEATGERLSQIFATIPAQTLNALALSLQQPDQEASFEDAMTFVAINTGVNAFRQWRRNQLRHFHDAPDRRYNRLLPMLALLEENRIAQRQETQTPGPTAQNDFEGEWPTDEEWGQAFDSAVERELRAPTLAQQAERHFAAGEFDAACTQAEQAVRDNGENVQALVAMGRCNLHRGEFALAEQQLNRALQSRFAEPGNYVSVSLMWIEADRRPQAEAALTLGATRYPQQFYAERMVFHARYLEFDRVNAIAAECQTADLPAPVKQECRDTHQDLIQRGPVLMQQRQQQGAQPVQPNAQPVRPRDSHPGNPTPVDTATGNRRNN